MLKTSPTAPARTILLAGAVVVLGAWNALGLPLGGEAGSPPVGPMPAPEWVDAPGSIGVGNVTWTNTSPVLKEEAHDPAVPGVVAPRVGTTADPSSHRDSGPADGAFVQFLDRVFTVDQSGSIPMGGPRSAGLPTSLGLAPAKGDAEPGTSEFVAGGAVVPGTPGSPAVDPGTAKPDARPKPVTEKMYYEDFLTLARTDPQELDRRADAVLRERGDETRQVALLRAMYDSDRTRALDRFIQAITFLPDQTRIGQASVPAFAVAYLGAKTNDPATKAVAERIAFTDYLNVSSDLRRSAAQALVANASDADLRRYADYPLFQEVQAANAAKAASP